LEPEDDGKDEQSTIVPVDAVEAGSLHADKGEEENLTIAMASVLAADYEVMNIPEEAESSIAVQAYIIPDFATNKAVSWSLSFVNPDSSWVALMEQEGLTIDDYVKIIPQGDNKIALACMNPFGEKIQLKVTSNAYQNVFATIMLDYEVRILGAKLKSVSPDGTVLNATYAMNKVGSGVNDIVQLNPEHSNRIWRYEVELETTAATYASESTMKMRLNPEFVEYLEDAGIPMRDIAYQSFTMDVFKEDMVVLAKMGLYFVDESLVLEGKDSLDTDQINNAVSAETMTKYKGAVNSFIAEKGTARLVTFTYYYGDATNPKDSYNVHFGSSKALFDIAVTGIETNPDNVVF